LQYVGVGACDAVGDGDGAKDAVGDLDTVGALVGAGDGSPKTQEPLDEHVEPTGQRPSPQDNGEYGATPPG